MNVLNTPDDTPCPKGIFCKQADGMPVAIHCQAGSYCPGDLSTTGCESGYDCFSATSKKICPAGSFCVGGETIPCEGGSFKINF